MSNWIKGKVGDLLQGLESGVSVNGYDRVPMPDERSVLKVSSVTYGIFNSDSAKPIKEKDAGRAKCNPRKGQIIISRSNTPELVGASALVDQDYPHRYLSDKLWQTVPRPNIQLCTKWLAFVLSSPEVRYKLSQLATGSSNSMKNITKDGLLSLPVLIPPYSEQKIISNALEQWDAAIEKTEALIDAKERQFGWLCQKFFTPNNDLTLSWQRRKIGEFVKQRKEKSPPTEDVPLYSLTIEDGVTAKTERYNREFLVKDKGNKTYKVVHPNDIVFNPANLRWGAIARSEVPHKVVLSPIYEVYQILDEKINADFLKYALTCKRQVGVFATKTEGTLIERMAVKADVFELCEISVPQDKEQQKKIAETLNSAQQEITLLKKLADQYRTQKRGLMQKLLSGEWHIKNKEAA